MSTRRRVFLILLAALLTAVGCLSGQEQPPGTPPPDAPGAIATGEADDGLANVERIEVVMLESFPVQVSVLAYGALPDGCTELGPVQQTRDGNRFSVAVTTVRPADAVCTQAIVPFEQTIALDVLGLPAGTYDVVVNGAAGRFELAVDNVAPELGETLGGIAGVVWHDLCAAPQGETAVPPDGCVAAPDGDFQADGELDGEPGIEGALVALGNGPCPADVIATTTTAADGTYTFVDLPAGQYCVSVNPLDAANEGLLIPGDWTYPEIGVGASSINLDPGALLTNVNFGWDHQFLPPPQVDCDNGVGFVADVTVPDNTRVDGGQRFVKTWRLSNTGTCAWGSGYSLVFVDGDQMGGPDAAPLTAVEPGATADLSVDLIAPTVAGTYRGEWKLRGPSGDLFGIGPGGDGPFWVQIISRGGTATAVPTAAPGATPAGVGALRGQVWYDVCHVTGGEGGEPAVPSDGCVEVSPGQYQANGLLEPAEPGIEGVEVTLAGGACPSTAVMATTQTAANGSYTFVDLSPGVYCLSVDALSATNEALLIPGLWTAPPTDRATAEIPLTLVAGDSQTGLNFGWDFQFD